MKQTHKQNMKGKEKEIDTVRNCDHTRIFEQTKEGTKEKYSNEAEQI